MITLKLILWIITYTIGVARLSLAFIMLVKSKKIQDFWKIAFLLVFIAIIISLSNFETLRSINVKSSLIFGDIAILCSALLTLTLPLYVHYSIDNLTQRPFRNGLFISLSATIIILIGIAKVSGNSAFYSIMFAFSVIMMSATVIYSMILLAIHNDQKPGIPTKFLIVFVIITIPLMIWIDFIKQYASSYIILPIMYLVVNIFMIMTDIKLLLNSPQVNSLSTEKLKKIGLTNREQEVASLLIGGMTYQQAADKLSISIQTFKTHASRIYAKTNSQNKMELLQKFGK